MAQPRRGVVSTVRAADIRPAAASTDGPASSWRPASWRNAADLPSVELVGRVLRDGAFRLQPVHLHTANSVGQLGQPEPLTYICCDGQG